MERLISIFGLFAFFALAYAMSTNKKNLNKSVIGWGIGLQIILAFFNKRSETTSPKFVLRKTRFSEQYFYLFISNIRTVVKSRTSH